VYSIESEDGIGAMGECERIDGGIQGHAGVIIGRDRENAPRASMLVIG
jgi:hypothetical protein